MAKKKCFTNDVDDDDYGFTEGQYEVPDLRITYYSR
jgi:hypothetical protein